MDHNKEFDGIQQADNPMPEWWKLFFRTCNCFCNSLPHLLSLVFRLENGR